MQIPRAKDGVIQLNHSRMQSPKKNEKRKAPQDAFLFLLFITLMGAALLFSFLNNYLFLDRLLTGGLIVGALALLKVINKKV